MIDHCTKWAEEVAWPSDAHITAHILWTAVFRHWIALWGCPLAILTDNASILESKHVHTQCDEMNIQKLRATTYHPQANGVIESWHRWLKRGLISGENNYLSLSDALATTLFTYRTTPHDSTAQTPMYLHVGYDALLPGLQTLTLAQPQPPLPERMRVLNEIRLLTWHTISSRVIARQPTKRTRAQQPTIKVGDLVVCKWRPAEIRWRNAIFGGAKFAPKWSEPRRVLNVTGTPPARLTLQSAWYNTSAMEASIHDVRVIPSLSHPSSLLENMKYVISALEKHCASTPRAPTPLPLPQALNNMLPSQINNEPERLIPKQNPRPLLAASEAEDALWPTLLATNLAPATHTSKATRAGRCEVVFSLSPFPD
eukprot:GHVU01020607.1.p1 GENE.GHVU01020607.1~~GHVU01020607.1.p1  ORF type:complete len:426 (+),score=24.50 GHVU01020607.1:174-1280(+)